jgi:anthranilate phosphoribosyltransferase
MKHAIGARKEMKQRSIFNLLGPLTNPAGARRQVMGVFSKDLTAPLAQVLGDLGAKHIWLVHGLEGLDELSMCGKSQVSEFKDGELKTFEFDPKVYGFKYANNSDLKADSIEESATIIKSVFAGAKGPCRDIVVLNAAAAILVSGTAKDYAEALEVAKHSLDTGKAQSALDRLVEMTADLALENKTEGAK